MGLRLTDGIDPARYRVLAGRPLDPARVAALVRGGFVDQDDDGTLRVTRTGFPVLDTVVAQLAA
jgi:oxygen-independent coproporphyrinogen-3 oxidase